MTTHVLGEEVAIPICLSATGLQGMAHHDGELATARGLLTDQECCSSNSYLTILNHICIIIVNPTAAARMSTCMMLSSGSTRSIEHVAQASGVGLRWFQLYVLRDRKVTKNFVERAERAGYKALVVTVDRQIAGRRIAVMRSNFDLPPHLSMAIFSEPRRPSAKQYETNTGLFDTSLTWEAIDWLREFTKLPIVLKGILTAEDAREALKHNIQGIIVSNHGGRQLDGVPATVRSQC